MKKKMVVTLLCGMMAFSLMACGGDSNAGANTEGGSISQQGESNKGESNKKEEKATPKKKYTKQIIYNTDGTEKTIVEYKYDEKGRETYYHNVTYAVLDSAPDTDVESTVEWTENGDTSTGVYSDGRTAEYKYDADGNLIEKTTGTSASYSTYTYTYQNGKRATGKTMTYMMGNLQIETNEVYNEYGYIAEYTSTYAQSGQTATAKYEYEVDKEGNILSVTTYSQGSEQGVKMDYVYDSNGYVDRIEVGGQLYQEVTCDKNGNMIEVVLYTNGTIMQKTITEYYEN